MGFREAGCGRCGGGVGLALVTKEVGRPHFFLTPSASETQWKWPSMKGPKRGGSGSRVGRGCALPGIVGKRKILFFGSNNWSGVFP